MHISGQVQSMENGSTARILYWKEPYIFIKEPYIISMYISGQVQSLEEGSAARILFDRT